MGGNKFLFMAVVGVGIVAGIFRFWQLTQYPVSLTMDEVAIGYGSYAMFKTGRDEWGKIAPLAFYSVGDYKPPVNYYLLVPSIAIFGLNEWAERMPVALLGSLSAVVMVVFLRRLGISQWAAAAGGLWLAMVPWQVHFSRFGIEAVTGVFFLLCGMSWCLKAMAQKRITSVVMAVICLGLSVWAYHSNRVFVPLVTTFLIIVQFKQLKFVWQKKINLVIVGGVLAILAGPFVYLLVSSPAISQRGVMTSILREPALQLALHSGHYWNFSEWILNNDLYLVFHHWVGKYLNYYDIQFWLGKGMGLTPPGYADSGLMYFWDGLVLAFGVGALVRSQNKLLKKLALFWFMAGPLAASIAMNEQHALRALVWVPAFGIIWAAGAEWWMKLKWRGKMVATAIYSGLMIVNVIYVKDLYTVQMPKFSSEYWGYGYKQAALYGCQNKDKYDRIVIGSIYGSEGPLFTGIPDYYVMFYCRYDPKKYMATHHIEKFDFGKADWNKELKTGLNTLVIAAKWDFPLITPPSDHIIKVMDYLNGLPAFYYMGTKINK